jgi:hypothetical protein
VAQIRHDVASEYILRELKHLLNQPTFIEATVQYLADLGWLAKGDDTLERRSELRKQVDLLRMEIQNLTNAVAEGRAVKSVIAALQEREQQQEALQRELDRLTITAQARPTNLSKVSEKVRARFVELLDQLSHHSEVARDVLRTVLTKRIVFKPEPETKVVRFFGELNIGRLFGVVPLERVETPLCWRPQRDARRVGVLGLFRTRRTPINQANPGLASSRGRFRCTSIDPVIPPEREKSRDDRSRKVPPGQQASEHPRLHRPFVASSQPPTRTSSSSCPTGKETGTAGAGSDDGDGDGDTEPRLVLAFHRGRVAIQRRGVHGCQYVRTGSERTRCAAPPTDLPCKICSLPRSMGRTRERTLANWERFKKGIRGPSVGCRGLMTSGVSAGCAAGDR